jgi:uncharacterized phiE125 gp8 family phage protein
MGLTLLAAPAVEPVTLADLKARLSIDHALSDPLLTSLIVTARATVERLSQRRMTSQTVRITLDRLPPGGLLAIPVAPVQTVLNLRVANAAGVFAEVPGDLLVLDLSGEPARLQLRGPIPQPGLPIGGISLDVVAGYGPTADAVPEPLRQAVALLAAHWFAHRGDTAGDGPPPEVAALAAPFRRVRLAA